MKKFLIGFALLVSTSIFASDMSSAVELNKSIAKAEFAADLWFCDSERALKELLDSMNIENSLACENAILKAKTSLEVSEISRILNQHLIQLKHIEAFEAEVKKGKNYVQLIPNVKALKANGLSLNLIKRYTQLTDEEMLVVELSFEKAKSKLERALENL